MFFKTKNTKEWAWVFFSQWFWVNMLGNIIDDNTKGDDDDTVVWRFDFLMFLFASPLLATWWSHFHTCFRFFKEEISTNSVILVILLILIFIFEDIYTPTSGKEPRVFLSDGNLEQCLFLFVFFLFISFTSHRKSVSITIDHGAVVVYSYQSFFVFISILWSLS